MRPLPPRERPPRSSRLRPGRLACNRPIMAAFDSAEDKLLTLSPDTQVDARAAFGVDYDMKAPAFSERDPHVPDIDEAYQYDPETTRAILAGFAFDRRVMVQGYHGTGKSTHIEQVAARLNWPLIRVN